MRDWTIRVTNPEGQKSCFYTTWATKKDAMDYARKLHAEFGPKGFTHEVLNRKTNKVTLVY